MSAIINQAWREYERKVLPADAPWVQKVECRRAFFRGAGAVLDLLWQLEEHRATEGDKALAVEGALQEVRAFRADVAGDRA